MSDRTSAFTEQRQIAAKAEQPLALMDTLEIQLASSLATAANLLSPLVAELTIADGFILSAVIKPKACA